MRQWNSRRPVDGLKRAMVSLFLLGPVPSAVVHAGDDPPAATSHAARAPVRPGVRGGSQLPGLPIFDQGREVPAGENLTFMVDRSEAGRLLLVSRDQKTRGWVHEDEVVPFEQATGYFGQVVLNDVRDADSFWVLGRLWFYLNDLDRARESESRDPAPEQPASLLSEPQPRSHAEVRRSASLARLRNGASPRARSAQGNPVAERLSSRGRLIHTRRLLWVM